MQRDIFIPQSRKCRFFVAIILINRLAKGGILKYKHTNLSWVNYHYAGMLKKSENKSIDPTRHQ